MAIPIKQRMIGQLARRRFCFLSFRSLLADAPGEKFLEGFF